jgi:DNA-binding transcriptional MerR regulator
MLFHKKDKKARASPLNEIRRMSASGLSDRDIIKQLKSKGYSLGEIESGMLEAVKQGVGSDDFQEPGPMEFAPRRGEYSMDQPPEPIFDSAPQEQIFEQEDMSSEDLSPELMIEELVEGVVDEKWQKFDSRIKALENEVHELLVNIKQVQQRAPGSEIKAVDDTKLAEINDQLEDMEVRVGGLEKAFKQFLPSLTKNIEHLSDIIKEMKVRPDED